MAEMDVSGILISFIRECSSKLDDFDSFMQNEEGYLEELYLEARAKLTNPSSEGDMILPKTPAVRPKAGRPARKHRVADADTSPKHIIMDVEDKKQVPEATHEDAVHTSATRHCRAASKAANVKIKESQRLLNDLGGKRRRPDASEERLLGLPSLTCSSSGSKKNRREASDSGVNDLSSCGSTSSKSSRNRSSKQQQMTAEGVEQKLSKKKQQFSDDIEIIEKPPAPASPSHAAVAVVATPTSAGEPKQIEVIEENEISVSTPDAMGNMVVNDDVLMAQEEVENTATSTAEMEVAKDVANEEAVRKVDSPCLSSKRTSSRSKATSEVLEKSESTQLSRKRSSSRTSSEPSEKVSKKDIVTATAVNHIADFASLDNNERVHRAWTSSVPDAGASPVLSGRRSRASVVIIDNEDEPRLSRSSRRSGHRVSSSASSVASGDNRLVSKPAKDSLNHSSSAASNAQNDCDVIGNSDAEEDPPQRHQNKLKSSTAIIETVKLTADVVMPPAELVIPPTKAMKSPAEAMKPTSKAMKPPVEAMKPPVEAMKPPVEAMKPPVEAMKPPVEAMKPPEEAMKPPVEAMKPPSDTMKSASDAMKPPSETMKPPSEVSKPQPAPRSTRTKTRLIAEQQQQQQQQLQLAAAPAAKVEPERPARAGSVASKKRQADMNCSASSQSSDVSSASSRVTRTKKRKLEQEQIQQKQESNDSVCLVLSESEEDLDRALSSARRASNISVASSKSTATVSSKKSNRRDSGVAKNVPHSTKETVTVSLMRLKVIEAAASPDGLGKHHDSPRLAKATGSDSNKSNHSQEYDETEDEEEEEEEEERELVLKPASRVTRSKVRQQQQQQAPPLPAAAAAAAAAAKSKKLLPVAAATVGKFSPKPYGSRTGVRQLAAAYSEHVAASAGLVSSSTPQSKDDRRRPALGRVSSTSRLHHTVSRVTPLSMNRVRSHLYPSSTDSHQHRALSKVNTPSQANSSRHKNIVTGIKSFLGQSNVQVTAARPTREEQEEQRQEELKRRMDKEDEIVKKREEMLRSKGNEAKRRNDERARKVAEARLANERKAADQKKALDKERRAREKALRLEVERERKAREEKAREDALRKKRKAEEEKRRQEEEYQRKKEEELLRRKEAEERKRLEAERRALLRQQEEERRLQEERERQIQEEEEAKRAAKEKQQKIAEEKQRREAELRAREKEELRLLQEREAARTAAAAAAAHKHKQQQQKKPVALNETYDANSTYVLPAANATYNAGSGSGIKSASGTPVTPVNTASSKKSQDSYDMTPASVTDYCIDDLRSDDSSDDDSNPKKSIPQWAARSHMLRAFVNQEFHPPDLSVIFPESKLLRMPDLAKIFPVHKTAFKQRSSSAHWSTPPHKIFSTK